MKPITYSLSNYELTSKQFSIFSSFQAQILQKATSLFLSTPEKLPLYTSQAHLIRLLIAREFNDKKAFEMWLKWVEWRSEFGIDTLKESDIDGELRTGKAFWHKCDKKKHPCIIIKTKRHFPKESEVDSLMKLSVFLIEKGCEEADRVGDGKICMIYDRKGFTMKNYDKRLMGLLKKLSGVLQDNYAERLDCLYILNPNWLFKMLYKITRPFLTQRTKDKIKIITNLKELEKYFDKDCLLNDMGGSSEFVYRYKDVVLDDLGEGKGEDEEEMNKFAKDVMKEEGIDEEELEKD